MCNRINGNLIKRIRNLCYLACHKINKQHRVVRNIKGDKKGLRLLANNEIDNISKQELATELKMVIAEYEALAESAKAILVQREFAESAKEIVSLCKKITGATSGYVALLSQDGSESEVLFLDSGGLKCTVDENLPMPIRGLKETAYRTRKGVYDNSFADSHWVKYLPEGHMRLENVLFAPLIIDNKAVGLIGLANKKGGFVQRDTYFISTLGSIAALALRNSRYLEEIQHLSFRDQLTGLYNRRYLAEQIQQLEGSREYPIAIVSMDIDNLKEINDKFGHSKGDLVLQNSALVITRAIRKHDLVARNGGDEFVLVMPRTNQVAGEKVIERINRKIEEYNNKNNGLPLSISMGLAVCEDNTRTLEETYQEADRLMYIEKDRRRKKQKTYS